MEKDKILDIGLSIMEGRGIEWVQETDNCILYKCNQYGYYFITDLEGSIIVPPGKYSYIDKFNDGFARVNKEKSNEKTWTIINTKGIEVLPLEYDFVDKFCDIDDFRFVKVRKNNTFFMYDTVHGDLYFWEEIDLNKEQKQKRKYSEFEGTYVQSVMGFSDDVINDAFDGEPDAYWNID